MNELTVLSWQNECELSPYPLVQSIGYNGLIIDANFLQFDNFVPVLNTITFTETQILVQIQLDQLAYLVEVDYSAFTGIAYEVIMRDDGNRYLGKLVFGSEAAAICAEFINSVVNANVSFIPSVVKSIPSNCGVYTIDNLFGNLNFTGDANITYAVSGQNVVFSAIALPTNLNIPYLKTINSVSPFQNSLYLQDSVIMKISSYGAGVVGFGLVGQSVDNVVSNSNNTISTNPDPS